MKGIYLCGYDLNNLTEGVNKKIIAQIRAMEENGIDIVVIDKRSVEYKECGYIRDNLNAIKGNASSLMQKLLEKALEKVKSEKIDFVYIRKQLVDKRQVSLLKKIKNCNKHMKIIMEIPTYPYDDEIRITRFLHLLLDKKYRSKLSNIVDRIVTFSKDNEIFGIKTINILNGASYEQIPLRSYKKHEGINCIAVAMFADWHGYDRFIQGMINDKAIVEDNNINLWLVGKGRVLKKYKDMSVNGNIANHVHFCGEMKGKDLYKIYDIADIALDSMGRHRVGVFYNSTLKGKEYCAAGIPILSGVETELDFMENMSFYCRVPANDSPVNMNELVEFYLTQYKYNNIDALTEKIRFSTINLFDLKRTFTPVIFYLRN